MSSDPPLKPAASPPPSKTIVSVLHLLVGGSLVLGSIALVANVRSILQEQLDQLHAVPDSELIITPELANASTLAQEELFAGLFKNEAGQLYGSVKGPLKVTALKEAVDFRPSTQPIATDARQLGLMTEALRDSQPVVRVASPHPPPPVASPPSPHPPVPTKPWLVEAATAPRPLNASLARLDSAPGRWAFGVHDVRPGTVLLANRPFGREKSYFDQTAVLLLKVCGCHPSIFGVILCEAGRRSNPRPDVAASTLRSFQRHSFQRRSACMVKLSRDHSSVTPSPPIV